MRLGILPAVGAGLASMARTGQLERLFVHLSYYGKAFDLTYFTWGDPAEERRLWQPFAEQSGAELVFVRRWGLTRALADCDILRPMNLLGAIPALYARAEWGIPFVGSYGADYAAIARLHGRPVWKWRLLTWAVLRVATRMLVSNAQLAARLHRRYPWAAVTHHPNWVDPERFQPDGRFRPAQRPTVLYVGRLVKEKHLDALALAVARLPGVRLVCVGDGPEREHLKALGAECVGAQPWTDLPYWYRGADVFGLPSYTEGHPKALTEAMASGVPCVVSPFVTEGGEAVWRTADLTDGIQRLLEPVWATHFGIEGRQYAIEHWNPKTLMAQEIAWLC